MDNLGRPNYLATYFKWRVQVKSGYYRLKHSSPANTGGPNSSTNSTEGIWKWEWNLSIPQNIKIFLWKACSRILPDTKPNPTVVLAKSKSLHRDCGSINNEVIKRGDHTIPKTYAIVWKPPRQGVVKINSDASFDASKWKGTGACLARNSKGDIDFGLAFPILASNALIVEALALREAISLARNIRVSNIVVESDSKVLVQACRREKSLGEIKMIVNDIIQIKGHFESCSFTWTPREANCAAHTIAKLASQNILSRWWSLCPSSQLNSILQRDKQNVYSPPLTTMDNKRAPSQEEISDHG
ncbi:Ribonuclease H-like superfamily [Sesbania bispinosa]|nr:Ribonuclease H-like superfamily [Sesbania bispinosa]